MASVGSFRHPYRGISPERRRRLTAQLLRQAHEADGADRERLLEEVVLVNIDVAQSIASRYRDRGIATEDLEQVACTALVRAAARFDVGHDRDFLAYAVPSIRGEIRRHFRDHGWTVRPPRRLQELIARVVAERDRQLGDGQDPTEASVAEALDVSVDEVREALGVDGCFSPASLDRSVADDSVETVGDLLADPHGAEGEVAAEARVMLTPVLRRLAPRDQRLLQLRFGQELSQQEIADAFGVTQTQVSRLLKRVLRDLRDALDGRDGSDDDQHETHPIEPTPVAAGRSAGSATPGTRAR